MAGAGAAGSAAAWQLAARGLRVLALDRFHPPHAEGSSHGGSRVIREMAFEHPRYVPLVRRAYPLWDALDPAGQRRLLIPTGALYLGAPDSLVVRGSRDSATLHGVPAEEMPAADVHARWPALTPEPGDVGLFERRAGVLRPEACIQAMLDAATAAGATFAFGEAVESWRADAGGVRVTTPARTIEAGALVLADGPWMLDELKQLGVAAWVERVVQHWFEPLRSPDIFAPERCPIYLWEDAAGVIFYGFPMLDGVLKAAVHHRGESTTMDIVRRAVTDEEVALVRERLARLLPLAAGRHRRSAVCLYTNTPDGDFIIDRHPSSDRVVVASACSGIGFKFMPVVGELVADLVTGATPSLDIAPFSFRRFG